MSSGAPQSLTNFPLTSGAPSRALDSGAVCMSFRTLPGPPSIHGTDAVPPSGLPDDAGGSESASDAEEARDATVPYALASLGGSLPLAPRTASAPNPSKEKARIVRATRRFGMPWAVCAVYAVERKNRVPA
jgi:hypothetical protein